MVGNFLSRNKKKIAWELALSSVPDQTYITISDQFILRGIEPNIDGVTGFKIIVQFSSCIMTKPLNRIFLNSFFKMAPLDAIFKAVQ